MKSDWAAQLGIYGPIILRGSCWSRSLYKPLSPPLLLSITLRSVLSVHMWTLLMFSFPVEEEKASCFGKAWQEAEDGGDLQSPGLLQAERQQGRQHVPGEAAGVRGLDLAGLRHALRAFLREGTPLC